MAQVSGAGCVPLSQGGIFSRQARQGRQGLGADFSGLLEILLGEGWVFKEELLLFV